MNEVLRSVDGKWSYEQPGRRVTMRHNQMLADLAPRTMGPIDKSWVPPSPRGSKPIDYEAEIMRKNGFRRDENGKVVPV